MSLFKDARVFAVNCICTLTSQSHSEEDGTWKEGAIVYNQNRRKYHVVVDCLT